MTNKLDVSLKRSSRALGQFILHTTENTDVISLIKHRIRLHTRNAVALRGLGSRSKPALDQVLFYTLLSNECGSHLVLH